MQKSQIKSRRPITDNMDAYRRVMATGNLGDMFHVYDVLASEDIQTFRDAARRIRGILHEHAVSTIKRPLAQVLPS